MKALLAAPFGPTLAGLLTAAALWPAYGIVALLGGGCILAAARNPQRRWEAFSVLAISMMAGQVLPQLLNAGIGPAPLVFVAVWVGAVLLWTRKPFGQKRALPALHALTAIAVVAVVLAKAVPAAIAAIVTLTLELLWRTSYWIRWRRRTSQPAGLAHLFALVPFIGAGGVPIGKSPEFFAKHEAADAAALVESQWEGLKLLGLAIVWRLLLALMMNGLWGPPKASFPAWALELQGAAPSLPQLFADPASFTLTERWLGMVLELFRALLELGIFGHTVVGMCCLIGFRIPRNTRAPLLATTILEFWNRYYFYFKELLVDFFFFPSYVALKGRPIVWRTVAAVFASAFLGNLYFHTLLYTSSLMQGKTDVFLEQMGARTVYGLLLAAGLSVSMARSLRGSKPPIGARRYWGMFLAAAFFTLLHVWNGGGEEVTLAQRLRLWMSLAP